MLVTKARGISSDYATWVRSLLGPEGLEISQRDQTIIAKKKKKRVRSKKNPILQCAFHVVFEVQGKQAFVAAS